MKLICLLMLFCSFSVAKLHAQEPKNSTTTITYSRTAKDAEDHGKYNSIKVDPLAVLTGEIPIYYERRLTNKLSAEFMAGITHSDYAFLIFNTDFALNTGTRTSKFGYLFGAAMKFYPSAETYALEGPFFGFDFRYKVYLTEIDNTCSPTSSVATFDERRSVIDGKLFGGYSWIFSNSITVEVFAGVGIRSQNIDGYICTDNSSPVTTFAKYDDNEQVLALSLGAKIGFAF